MPTSALVGDYFTWFLCRKKKSRDQTAQLCSFFPIVCKSFSAVITFFNVKKKLTSKKILFRALCVLVIRSLFSFFVLLLACLFLSRGQTRDMFYRGALESSTPTRVPTGVSFVQKYHRYVSWRVGVRQMHTQHRRSSWGFSATLARSTFATSAVVSLCNATRFQRGLAAC